MKSEEKMVSKKNMRPIFTVHAGDLLIGEYIEKIFKTQCMGAIERYWN
jgi:hypothetical protein